VRVKHLAGKRLERSRQAGDLAVIVGALLSILAVIGGAALAAWTFSADDERLATAAPVPNAPMNY
jgi:ribosomal protein L18E